MREREKEKNFITNFENRGKKQKQTFCFHWIEGLKVNKKFCVKMLIQLSEGSEKGALLGLCFLMKNTNKNSFSLSFTFSFILGCVLFCLPLSQF